MPPVSSKDYWEWLKEAEVHSAAGGNRDSKHACNEVLYKQRESSDRTPQLQGEVPECTQPHKLYARMH